MLFTPTAYLGDSDVPSNYHGFWVLPYGVETVGHGGNTAGCSSFLLLDLQNEIGAVVMTNQSNEQVYNYEMIELIFGKFSEQDYFNEERSTPEGIYRPARTVRTGPFKITSLSFMSGEMEPDTFWMTGTNGGVERICLPYGDSVRVPIWQFVLEVALFLLWIAAVLFSIVSLLVKIIRKLVYRCKKKPIATPLGGWSTFAAMIQVVTVLLFAGMSALAISFALSSTYAWMTVVFGIIMVVMTGTIIYGIVMRPKTELTKRQSCYNWMTILLLLVAVINIIYWNLFMGWKI